MHYSRLMLLLYSTLGIVFSGCSSQQSTEKEKTPAIPVHAAQVSMQDVPLYIHSMGTLKPASLVEIRPQASGVLQAVHFTEGQFIKKGALLFTIDNQPYVIRLHESEAQLAQNKAVVDNLEKKYERYASIANKELISLQEWDEMRSQTTKQKAQIQGDEAKVAAARLDLQCCKIKAPIDGKVGKLAVHPGNLVAAGQVMPLTSLANIDTLIVEFAITEREYQQLSSKHLRGDYPIEVCPLCSPSEISKGMLTFFDNTFDTQTGLLTLQGTISNSSHQLLPGQHVQVHIPIETMQNALVIPQKAVNINQKGPYVFIVKEDQTVDMRTVKTGIEINDLVVVVDGLTIKDVVITEGHLRLSPGLTVEICDNE